LVLVVVVLTVVIHPLEMLKIENPVKL